MYIIKLITYESSSKPTGDRSNWDNGDWSRAIFQTTKAIDEYFGPFENKEDAECHAKLLIEKDVLNQQYEICELFKVN